MPWRPATRPWPDASRRASETVVAGAALAVLAILVAVDAVGSRHYVLVGYFGLAPLMAASTARPSRTAAVAAVALAAAVTAGDWDAGRLLASEDLIRAGIVAASGVLSVYLATIRTRREQQLLAMSRIADFTQQAVLRPLPERLPGLRLASAYHSATAQARVGGDFFEAVAVGGSTRLVIGDAKGKGLSAVRMSATALGAFRHAALHEPTIEAVAAALDATIDAYGDDEDFVTALLVEQAPPGVLRLVCCGHHPPLLGPPGQLRPVTLGSSGLPLGLGGERQVEQWRWETGSLLVLYTDGLVEARDGAGRMLSIEEVAGAVVADQPASAVAQLLSVLHRHGGETIDDDLAVVVCRSEPATADG